MLDRIPHLDPRNRGFSIVKLRDLAVKPPRSFSWSCQVHLDQGNEGECVPHGFAHEALARPVVRNIAHVQVHEWYRLMQARDPWRDEPHEGTTVLAGAQVYVEAGRATGYHWAFGLAETILTLGYAGPVVFGLDWTTGMFYPNEAGVIRATGQVEGGHCLLGKGVKLYWLPGTTTDDRRGPDWLSHLDLDSSYVLLHQSWGEDYGLGGDVRLPLSDLDYLLGRQGEVCVPTGRR